MIYELYLNKKIIEHPKEIFSIFIILEIKIDI